jgi:hypothetical protein
VRCRCDDGIGLVEWFGLTILNAKLGLERGNSYVLVGANRIPEFKLFGLVFLSLVSFMG